MMSKKTVFIMLLSLCFGISSIAVAAPKKTGKNMVKQGKQGKKGKKTQFIDLEGLEVQGLIDRPQTLYILKKSDTLFKDNIDEYDYMKAIIDSTYKEPF